MNEEVLAKVSTLRYSVHMATPSFPKFPSFPNIDFSSLDLSKLPKVELPSVDTDAITTAAKDAFYVTVGLGVLAYQKAQVRRQEMTKAFNDQFGSGKAQFETQVAGLETRLDALEAKIDSAVGELEKRLPEKAGALLGQAHDAAKAARKQVRELITSSAA